MSEENLDNNDVFESLEEVKEEALSSCQTCQECENGGCPVNVGEVKPPEAGEPVDPTLEFDLTRKDRQGALSHVQEVLQRAQSGAKLSRKDIVKALKNIQYHAVYLDELVVTLLQEMYRIVQALAQQEVNDFALRTNLKTVVIGLDKKGLISEEELSKIFKEEILPAELGQVAQGDQVDEIQKEETQEALRSEKEMGDL